MQAFQQVLLVALCFLCASSAFLAPLSKVFLHEKRGYTIASATKFPSRTQLNAVQKEEDDSFWNGIKELWNEIIEVSTYGPSERKLLKVQRERKRQREELVEERDPSAGTQTYKYDSTDDADLNDDEEWLQAFKSAKTNQNVEDTYSEDLEYDGYALRDLLVSQWRAPLDVDFQRIGDQFYCTVLPQMGFGSPLRSRHESEVDYLMHLQGVIEILHKYDNLEYFLTFIETTEKSPKRGTDAVLYRLNLSNEQKAQITDF